MKPAERFLCVICVVALPTVAQDAKPDFTGTWLYEPSPFARDRELDRIDHREPDFKISEKVGRADVIVTFAFRTDGQELEQNHGENGVVRTAHWDGKTVVLDTKWTRDGAVTTTKHEELSLSEDGKIMTKVVRFSGARSKPDQKIELRKISNGFSGIKMGDSEAVVRHEWGEPDTVEERGKETVFVYIRQQSEVIFTEGKLSDIRHRPIQP
jgi:hypothetical protein